MKLTLGDIAHMWENVTLLELDENNIEIIEIAVSVLLDRNFYFQFDNSELLYELRVVTNNELKRLVFLVPVNQLLAFVAYTKNKAIEVEHIFDY